MVGREDPAHGTGGGTRRPVLHEVVDLIAAHDAPGARAAMEQHILNGTERWRLLLHMERNRERR